MAEADTIRTRHDLEAKIVKRCWENEEFRKEFTADPTSAFVKYLTVPVAGIARIVVHEEEPGCWHIVLPVKPAHAGELSDQELETVAGGTLSVMTVATAATVTLWTVATATVEKGW